MRENVSRLMIIVSIIALVFALFLPGMTKVKEMYEKRVKTVKKMFWGGKFRKSVGKPVEIFLSQINFGLESVTFAQGTDSLKRSSTRICTDNPKVVSEHNKKSQKAAIDINLCQMCNYNNQMLQQLIHLNFFYGLLNFSLEQHLSCDLCDLF